MKNFGTLLKKLRTEANLTQDAFATKLHLSKSTISKWETGSSTPDVETLLRISQLFNISCDDLLHPTETLSKESAPSIKTSWFTTPFSFSPKKILLICIPVFLLGISLGVIGSHALTPHIIPVVSENNDLYTLIETRRNVDTSHGSAYELIYRLSDTTFNNQMIIEFANAVADAWKLGHFPDSTENVLVISFYPASDNTANSDDTYFQALYIK